jgi:hypothetical protein
VASLRHPPPKSPDVVGALSFLRVRPSRKSRSHLSFLGVRTYATGGLANDVGPTSLQGKVWAIVATSSKVHFNDNVVRVGVNYHFGSPAVSQY